MLYKLMIIALILMLNINFISGTGSPNNDANEATERPDEVAEGTVPPEVAEGTETPEDKDNDIDGDSGSDSNNDGDSDSSLLNDISKSQDISDSGSDSNGDGNSDSSDDADNVSEGGDSGSDSNGDGDSDSSAVTGNVSEGGDSGSDSNGDGDSDSSADGTDISASNSASDSGSDSDGDGNSDSSVGTDNASSPEIEPTDISHSGSDSDNDGNSDSSDDPDNDSQSGEESNESEEVDVCLGIEEEADCLELRDDEGFSECGYNDKVESNNCYSVEASDGEFGSGTFDDGYIAALDSSVNDAEQLEILVGILGGIIAALILVIAFGGYWICKQQAKDRGARRAQSLDMVDVENKGQLITNRE